MQRLAVEYGDTLSMANVESMQPGNGDGTFSSMWGNDDSDVFYNQSFDTLELPKLQLKNSPQHEYLIYSNNVEFEVVQAKTALEAIRQSSITAPYKIVHTGNRLAAIIGGEKLKAAVDTSTGTSDKEEQEQLEHATADVTSTPQEEAPQLTQAAAETTSTEKKEVIQPEQAATDTASPAP